jgi:hypothetical protein
MPDLSPPLAHYRYRGARALVLLHERELTAFVSDWKTARARGIALPGDAAGDENSLPTLLAHVLWWARDYLVWTCEKLGLPDPDVRPAPEPAAVETALDDYLPHLLERWRIPLAEVPAESFARPLHAARWGVEIQIEILLEHAVVHPMRHRLQLAELMS